MSKQLIPNFNNLIVDSSGLCDRTSYSYFENLGQNIGDNGEVILPVFTTATRPTPTNRKAYLIYSDTDSEPLFSDGTNWRKVTDGSIT